MLFNHIPRERGTRSLTSRRVVFMSEELPDEERFQFVADSINNAVRATVAETLKEILSKNHPCGPDIVAAIAGIVTAAGYLCGNFEPQLKGDLFSLILVDQFNEGRKAAAQ